MQFNKLLNFVILLIFLMTLFFFTGCRDLIPFINHRPTISALIADSLELDIGQSTVITCYANDQDGNILTYNWSKTGGVINGSDSVITWTAPTTAGTYTINCSISDGELFDSKSLTIVVIGGNSGVVYRVFCVGVGDYKHFPDDYDNYDLPSPPYDVDRIRQIFGYCKFGPTNIEFSDITYLKDWEATKANILQGITSTFSGADSNDISYFYFSGHGKWVEEENCSYLCPTEIYYDSPLNSYISVNELEKALSAIPGTKVVFLDSCHSGGFIGKGKEKISQDDILNFNNDIINIFSQNDFKKLLTSSEYQVLTSCHYYQTCLEVPPIEEIAFDPFGIFTMALCAGCGYYGNYPADINGNTQVTLQEAYLYVKNWLGLLNELIEDIDITQDVQVYPYNSTFTIVEY
jgi:hypothetical protein